MIKMEDKLREECGILGIYSSVKSELASSVYYGLYALQHRGQESCGMVVNNGGEFKTYKDSGLVNEVFTKDVLRDLGIGNMALGHVRYGTVDSKDRINAQPMIINHLKGKLAIAHNGSIVNAANLRTELEMNGSIFHTSSDAEVISYAIIRERMSSENIEEAIDRAMSKIKGAYSIVIMTPSKMIALRDENGFRPLCYGQREDGSYVIASESCALDSIGAKFIRDIEPGEIVTFSHDGIKSITAHCGKQKEAFCVFEYIYFSRPDSVVEGCSVHAARVRAGELLAESSPVEADVVIGVPDSGLDAAVGYSRASGIPYGIGLIKNKYIGRTFIDPGQSVREDKVRIKLNPVAETLKGKRVVMVDDSIVRGTTCARIVKLIRNAGAKEVHMRVSSPPFLNPCYYGTDIDSKERLIANNHTIDEIRDIIGVDTLGYLGIDDAKRIADKSHCKGFCTACFDGEYPGGVPSSINEKDDLDS